MGQEATCTLEHEGRSSDGRACFETDEIIFRGTFRLAIKLNQVEDAYADDGVLTVRWSGKTARFDLGRAADKWADKIVNPPTVIDKLGLKTGQRVAVLGFADDVLAKEVEAATGVKALRRTASGLDVVFLAADDRKTLGRLPALRNALAPDGAVWVVRPKGSDRISENDVMAAGRDAGLYDVKVVRFSDTHTAEKFVIPKKDR
jgi:DUF3052 family protein